MEIFKHLCALLLCLGQLLAEEILSALPHCALALGTNVGTSVSNAGDIRKLKQRGEKICREPF